MKRCIALLLSMILLASILSGCLSSSDPKPETLPTKTAPTTTAPTQAQPTTVPTQPTTVPTQPEAPDVELEAQADYSVDPYPCLQREGWPKIISSVEELEELANSDIGRTFNYVPDAIERYDDSFFEEHTLLLVYLYTYPVFLKYHVRSCIKLADGSYSIVLYGEQLPWGDCANMPRYIVTFIAVKDHVPKDAVIHFTFLDENTKLITN